ncbi:AMP-binding protein [Scandinavium lactucae]|uniref:AMP-binding protein n=1 Tax=Scandinavium lactucae TaxID=3095028 RepID=A0ABU4QJK9_9ENTR|nr:MULTISPECIES: AMP-binding protein [unclassified Scandinavium]MDX6039485.1 AMP-binding protein [Scandinavium sp. V105_6]MDX6048947.1 AMP-binding protein [Scandinavium sp. V105_1]
MKHPLPLSQWLNPTRPDETCIAWLGTREWQLGELRHDVVTLMQALHAQPGTRWALCFENSYLFVVALLATLHAGKVPVIPGHCRVSLLNEQQDLFDGILSEASLDCAGPQIVVSARSASTSTHGHDITPSPIAADSVIELFTSGSTGQPKKIIKPVALLDAEAQMLHTRFEQRLDGCRVVASVVPQHLYGLTFRIFLPMACGMPLHASMLYYAEQLSALPAEHRYVFISSPAFLKRLDANLIPPPVSMLLSAGGMLPWKEVKETQSWLKVWLDEIYGSTETGVIAWRQRIDNGTSWQLFPGVTLRAEDDEWRLLSPLLNDEQGLLLDDMIELVDDGFRLAGRRGRVVKIEEKRVSLSEIEQRLMTLEGIEDAVALPVSRGGRQGIGVVLVLTESARQQWQANGGKAQEQAWRLALMPWLESVAVPRYWRVLDEIPVNSMNKRVYAQLQELFS